MIAEAPGELPVGLARHIRTEAPGLGFEGVGLVVLVGRDPGVGGNSHGWAPSVRWDWCCGGDLRGRRWSSGLLLVAVFGVRDEQVCQGASATSSWAWSKWT
ncbi:MAG: hypothetical protein ACYDGN_09700 [Acidimicrobiales bacterium]